MTMMVTMMMMSSVIFLVGSASVKETYVAMASQAKTSSSPRMPTTAILAAGNQTRSTTLSRTTSPRSSSEARRASVRGWKPTMTSARPSQGIGWYEQVLHFRRLCRLDSINRPIQESSTMSTKVPSLRRNTIEFCIFGLDMVADRLEQVGHGGRLVRASGSRWPIG